MAAKTKAKEKEPETPEVQLPPADMYKLQIVEVQYRPDTPQYQGGTKNEYVVIAELVGTQNPDQDNEPFKVWIWGLREVKTLIAKFVDKETKKRVEKATNGYILLNAMGFDPDGKTLFSSINWEALEGGYLSAWVDHSKDGRYLAVKLASDIKPLKDKALLEHNEALAEEIFGEG